ncbi:ParA family protein [Thaumasiovibrio subtropicus]|uniref:ParA family protein n=1 Tax=Thaumasiovibrio subtropicus TaxID=1891207 RepID=UPI000B357442|nr:ParA family protein [Thaumasiovibrio subtropicus]
MKKTFRAALQDFQASLSSVYRGSGNIVVVNNEKGGVGKTTSAVHVACAAVDAGLKVLCIDVDPQGNFTRTMNGADLSQAYVTDNNFISAADLFYDKLNKDKTYPIRENLHLVAATDEMYTVDESGDKSRVIAAYQNVKRIMTDGAFDLCIIDTPPTVGNRQLAALLLADVLVMPLEVDAFSIKGLEKQLTRLTTSRRAGGLPMPKVSLMPSRVDLRYKLTKDQLASLSEVKVARVTPPIKHSGAISHAISAGKATWDVPVSSRKQVTEMLISAYTSALFLY